MYWIVNNVDDRCDMTSYYWNKCCAALVTWLILTNPVSAASVQMDVSADECAIYRALTGAPPERCSMLVQPDLGIERRLPPASAFPREAAPLKSVEEEKGYFIRFPFDSNKLTGEYKAHLQRLSKVLGQPGLANSCVKLVGHSDSVGDPDYNRKLSASRSAMVAAYLASDGGIAMGRIITDAKGEADLLANVPGAHPLNRRVEILAKKQNGTTCK